MRKLNDVVIFACSEGGHFAQMMALSQLFGRYHSVLVTDNYRANQDMPALKNIEEIAYVGGTADSRKENANNPHNDRRLTYLKGYLKMFCQCFRVLRLFRPKVIVSTGSNVAVPLFWAGKMMGCKLIFIETRAHVYNKSLSDVVIVQWKEMLDVYKNAEYYGVLV